MNKHIKKLAEQASNQTFGHINRNEFFEQKFAALLIKECARLIKSGLPVDELEEHFGVE